MVELVCPFSPTLPARAVWYVSIVQARFFIMQPRPRRILFWTFPIVSTSPRNFFPGPYKEQKKFPSLSQEAAYEY